jgi:HAD superfamily hydrolase (TIGR01549 family)
MSKEEVLGLWGPPGDEIFKSVFPSDVVEEAWNEFLVQYRNYHTKEGFFSRTQLQKFRDKVPFVTIFTGKSRQTNKISLEELGISDCFDLIYTGNDVKKSKPDPEAIHRIMEDLELEKNEVIFIGDSHLDIQAGKSAGIFTAAALWGAIETEKLLDTNPDFIFHSPSDFIEFINKN